MWLLQFDNVCIFIKLQLRNKKDRVCLERKEKLGERQNERCLHEPNIDTSITSVIITVPYGLIIRYTWGTSWQPSRVQNMSRDAAVNFDWCQSFSISESKHLHYSVAALSSALNNFLKVFAECQPENFDLLRKCKSFPSSPFIYLMILISYICVVI